MHERPLKSVEEAVLNYEDYVRTGYDRLDVILTEKKMSARSHGVSFKALIDGNDFTFLSLEDLYSLFGNLLDNAVESNIKAKEGAERFINVRSHKNGNFLYLAVENYSDGDIRWTAVHRPMTSKKGKDPPWLWYAEHSPRQRALWRGRHLPAPRRRFHGANPLSVNAKQAG